MKSKRKIPNNNSQNLKTRIMSELRSELPVMQSKYLKRFRGNHNFINKFIHVPDLVNGGQADNLQDLIKQKCDLEKHLSSGGIEYDLIYFSVDKSMRLKFKYYFSDRDSGLSGIASLIESAEGWKVGKIEDFD